MGFGLTAYFPLLYYISFISMIFVILFYKVEYGIYYITFFIPFQNLMDKLIVFPMGSHFIDILILAMLIKTLFTLNKKKVRMFDEKSNKLIVGLICYTFLNLLITGNLEQILVWKNYIRILILYFIVYYNIEKEGDVKMLIFTIAASILLMNLYYSHNYYAPAEFSFKGRYTGTFSYLGPNETGIFYAWYIPFVFTIAYFERSRIQQMFLIAVSIMSLHPLAYTFSRAAYLSFLFGSGVFAMIKSKLILILIIIFVLTWKVILPAVVIERIEMSFDEAGGYDVTIQQREGLIGKGLGLFMSSPIYGHGFASTAKLAINDGMSGKIRSSLHNGVIQILVEMGIIGIFIFISIYIAGAKSGWQLYKASSVGIHQSLGLGFVICSLTGLFTLFLGNAWLYYNINGFFWVLFGVTNKCNNMYKNKSEIH